MVFGFFKKSEPDYNKAANEILPLVWAIYAGSQKTILDAYNHPPDAFVKAAKPRELQFLPFQFEPAGT